MNQPSDPADAIRRRAASLSGVAENAACTQSAFKTRKGAFLFIGPGAKGAGFKAMFKLDASMAEARRLAARDPERFEVGGTGWVTARFTAERPLPEKLWSKWLTESHELVAETSSTRPAGAAKHATRRATRG